MNFDRTLGLGITVIAPLERMNIMAKQTVVVNVRLSLDEVARIDEIAQEDDRSRGYIIRKLLRESLDAMQGNDLPIPEEASE